MGAHESDRFFTDTMGKKKTDSKARADSAHDTRGADPIDPVNVDEIDEVTMKKAMLMSDFEIDEKLADQILDQRNFGGFKQLEDIVEKKMLRKGKFKKWKQHYLTMAVENKPSSFTGKYL